MVSQQNVIEAFYRLYQAYHHRHFTKTLNFTQKTEQELLPMVRCYLLGYFDHLEPEAKVQVTNNYQGRLDFFIDNVAVEFTVRSKNKGANNLKAENNVREIKKLMKHPNHSLMILFDFKKGVTEREVEKILKEYRNIPSLGRGNPHRYPFTVVYFYQDEDGDLCYYPRRIRVKRRPVSLSEDKDIIEKINVINHKNLTAREYDNGELIHDYPVEVRIKDNELTVEYQDDEGNYYQYKGEKKKRNIYELISTESSNDKATVSLFIDEDDHTLTIEGILIEGGSKKEWIIEEK
ncbi:hypothetical protein BKK52_11960 [Rodentibacter trehalosifermentans]|uniref:Uncharacterized protein n=1 Tax=Rodentibacter trehalosifermentans TaxID=1908263 RepID=A0A1V3IU61_9PAST|nr:hypothetical protein [Rodentibacter trehalosifermentans]OOF45821.1 hypothetical protein BKK52_11960 [Rodentibacter trehalosifermentans]